MKNIIIASTSTLYGQNFLSYILPELSELYQGCKTIIFVPYARPNGISYEEYTTKVSNAFQEINIEVKGLHEFENPAEALQKAAGVFVGGGNTFVLVDQLYKLNLMNTLTNIVQSGTPYLGTSAGSNITGLTMQTTNDMPIIYPQSFKTLGLVPFNINPHFLDYNPDLKHNGESRETRIKEFHTYNSTPVLGLREGSWLRLAGDSILLKGKLSAKLFLQNKDPYEIVTETEINWLK